MEYFCDSILNLDQWFRKCHLKVFLINNSDGHLNGRSETICKIMEEGIIRNSLVNLF